MMKSKLMGGASTKLVNVISDLEERHLDILKLEKVILKFKYYRM